MLTRESILSIQKSDLWFKNPKEYGSVGETEQRPVLSRVYPVGNQVIQDLEDGFGCHISREGGGLCHPQP